MRALAAWASAVLFLSACSGGESKKPAAEAVPDAAPTAAPAPPPAPPPAPALPDGIEHISLTVKGSLEESMKAAAPADIAAPLAQVTARLLIWWVDVARGLRKGDSIDVVYQQVAGKEPLVHALRFYSTKDEKEHRAYLYKPEGGRFAHYYSTDGEEVEERLRNSPIDDYEQVTSILRDGRHHKGVDFKAPSGTPVKVPFDATLSRKNWSWRRNGNCLEFHDAQGRRIVFLHLSELPKSLKEGTHFKAGQTVAESGNTGHTTAPHLHYQLEGPDGKLLDPFKVHETYRAKLSAEQMTGFAAARARFDSMLAPAAGKAASAAPAPAPEPAAAAAEPAPASPPAAPAGGEAPTAAPSPAAAATGAAN